MTILTVLVSIGRLRRKGFFVVLVLCVCIAIRATRLTAIISIVSLFLYFRVLPLSSIPLSLPGLFLLFVLVFTIFLINVGIGSFIDLMMLLYLRLT